MFFPPATPEPSTELGHDPETYGKGKPKYYHTIQKFPYLKKWDTHAMKLLLSQEGDSQLTGVTFL